MDAGQIAKIECGVRSCLDACRESNMPFARIGEFIDRLNAGSSWTSDEIRELRRRVIKVLYHDHLK